MEDKRKILTSKTTLRTTRRYRDVFIHSDQTKEERLMSANLRSLINAYKAGDSNIHLRGSKIVTSNTGPSRESSVRYNRQNGDRNTSESAITTEGDYERVNSRQDNDRDVRQRSYTEKEH